MNVGSKKNLPAGSTGIVRMKDIADRGNVSLATVSQVLRGQNAERYSKATRDKVQRVARELGWSPNRLVRGIQTGSTGLAGLLMIASGAHWERLATGLQLELLARRMIPVAMHPDYSPGNTVTELELLRNLMELRVEGIICWPLFDAAANEFLANVCAKQVPVVTLDFQLPDTASAIEVRTPEDRAMELCLNHLVQLGHRQIGYVGFNTPGDWVLERRSAFVEQMAARGLSPAFVEAVNKGTSPASFELDAGLHRATAVVAATEQLAVSVWHVAQNIGLAVPRDLSIVGFGQFKFDFAIWPTFTSIDQRPEEIGRVAAGLLVDPSARNAVFEAAASASNSAPHVDVEPALVLGQTTAAPSRR